MRIPYGQIFFALGLGSTTHWPPGAHLARFLAVSKAEYMSDVRSLSDVGEKWTMVMGNEAADLDSMASAIAFAWIQSNVHHKPTIPLLQTYHHDLFLRPENLHALGLANIHDPISQLLTLSDLTNISPFPSTHFALVDHNRLGPIYSSPHVHVSAVVDHHEDEGFYNNTARPRIIAPSGSCSSHVAMIAPRKIPSDLATLLLSAILVDTGGLKPGGKALPVDLHAASILAKRSTHIPFPPESEDILFMTPEIRSLTRNLLERKRNVQHLTASELIRRDYKEYTMTASWMGNQTIKAGLATVPLSLEALDKKGDLGETMVAWMMRRGIVTLGVATSFRNDKKSVASTKRHRREIAWVVNAAGLKGIGVDRLSTKLWKGIEGSEDLGAQEHKDRQLDGLPAWSRSKTYELGNLNASRKVMAPLLRQILEGSGSES